MIQTLRILGNIEGISYLLLLGVAMPMKYYFEMPMAVKITGMAHGVLFVAYCYTSRRLHEEVQLEF